MDNNEAFFKEIKEIGIGLCSNCSVSTWRIEELWQAAQQQSAGEIAELNKVIAGLQLATNKLRKTLKHCEHTLKGFSTDLWSNELLAKVSSTLRKTRDHWIIKDEEITEMKSKIKTLEDKNQSSLNYTKQLKADNERLREALAKVTRACYGMYPPKYLEDALSATTSSLVEHNNEVIQR